MTNTNGEVFKLENDVRVARGQALAVETYHPPLVETHQTNPLIRAIPPLPDHVNFGERLANKPDWKRSYLEKPAHERALMPIHLKKFFMPLGCHYVLAQGIRQLIDLGYSGRNPLSVDYEVASRARLNKITEITTSLPDEIESAMVTGMSGLGKSISVVRILQKYFPQILMHNSFEGRPFPHTQIAWIYLSCPYNCSVHQLSSQFLREVDIALDSVGVEGGFQKKHLKEHSSASSIFAGLCEIATLCTVGMVIIDEIQNLTAQKLGGAKTLLNFVVQIQNTLGVPVLLVGNGSIHYLLDESFRMVRRTSFLRSPNWTRLRPGEEWDRFIKHLWKFQYLEPAFPLTDALKETFYECTGGIPDIIGDLFRFVQEHVINERIEILTPEVIRDVAKNSLPAEVRKLIRALHERDFATLGAFEDLHITDLEPELISDKDYERGAILMAEARAKKERARRRTNVRKGLWVPGS